jgi:hypothetical protein
VLAQEAGYLAETGKSLIRKKTGGILLFSWI